MGSVEPGEDKISIVTQEIEMAESSNTSSPSSSIVQLSSGKSFEEEELELITYKYPSNFILVLGEPSSGKSTLYGALFDSFHKGGCGDYYFAGTKTPIGFEEICHYAREKCKARISKTERTKSYQFTYLHLAVRHKDLKQDQKHLIFADVNGERFQAAKDSDAEMQKLAVLKRADHIFFIADGGLLLDQGERHNVKNDVKNLIARCVQNNMFTAVQSVSLIITKWDEVNAAGKEAEIDSFFITPMVSRFNTTIKSVLKLASRSTNVEVPARTGIDKFLDICVGRPRPSEPELTIPVLDREYKKYKYLAAYEIGE